MINNNIIPIQYNEQTPAYNDYCVDATESKSGVSGALVSCPMCFIQHKNQLATIKSIILH